MLSFYFGGSFLPLSQSKAFYKFGFFDGIFGDFQEKHEFATLLKNTSALPRDFMHSVSQILSGRFFQILWPSQKIRTLTTDYVLKMLHGAKKDLKG